jgi:hypothetical protein
VVLRGLALGVQLPFTHPAAPARDVEGDDDPVAGFSWLDLAADLLDDAHRLVAEHVTRREVGPSTS